MNSNAYRLCLTLAFWAGTFAVSFSQTSPVPVSLGQDTAVCLNESLTLDASYPNCVYQWSTGATTASISVNNFPATYAVTVTDSTGTLSPGMDEIEVSSLNIPPVNISPGGTAGFCPGDSVLLTGSFGGTSIWYRNGIAIPGPHTETYWASSPGRYNMTKTNLNGCTDSASVATLVEISAPPMAGWISNRDSVDLGVSGEVIFYDTSSNASSWNWDFGDGGSSTASDPVYSYTTAGIYSVLQVVENAACKDSASRTIVVFGMVANDPFGVNRLEAVLFPNPVSEDLKIKVSGQAKYQFELFSPTGLKVVSATVGAGTQTFDVSSFPKGVYVFEFLRKGRSLSQGKLVLQ